MTEDRITALEDAITNASSLNDLKARVRAATDSEHAPR